MRDRGISGPYLPEADQHILDAEGVLRGLGTTGSTRMRRMRAAMYVKALRRLRGLIAVHESLPWDQADHAAPIGRTDHTRHSCWSMHWPGRFAVLGAGHECRDG